MRKSNQAPLRETLLLHSDGMTISELSKTINKNSGSILRSLNSMPDTYIDRWIYKRGQFAGVWCVVVPPEDCPHPERKK